MRGTESESRATRRAAAPGSLKNNRERSLTSGIDASPPITSPPLPEEP